MEATLQDAQIRPSLEHSLGDCCWKSRFHRQFSVGV